MVSLRWCAAAQGAAGRGLAFTQATTTAFFHKVASTEFSADFNPAREWLSATGTWIARSGGAAYEGALHQAAKVVETPSGGHSIGDAAVTGSLHASWVTVSASVMNAVSSASDWFRENAGAGNIAGVVEWLKASWVTVSASVMNAVSSASDWFHENAAAGNTAGVVEWLEASWVAVSTSVVNAVSSASDWFRENAAAGNAAGVVEWLQASWVSVSGWVVNAVSSDCLTYLSEKLFV